jgi:AcrR family transcriptional regulator
MTRHANFRPSQVDGSPRIGGRRRPQVRAQDLQRAALDLFAEKGFAATTCEEVASRAGVSKGTLFLYFQSKEALLQAVIREHLQTPIAEGAQLAAASNLSSAELLRSLMRLWSDSVASNVAAGICKVIVSEARNFPALAQFYVNEVFQPGHRLIASAIRRGVESGEFRWVSVDDVVHVIMSTPMFLATQRHSLAACACIGREVDEAAVLQAQFC